MHLSAKDFKEGHRRFLVSFLFPLYLDFPPHSLLDQRKKGLKYLHLKKKKKTRDIYIR